MTHATHPIPAGWVLAPLSTAMTYKINTRAVTHDINTTAVTHNINSQDTHAQGEQPSTPTATPNPARSTKFLRFGEDVQLHAASAACRQATKHHKPRAPPTSSLQYRYTTLFPFFCCTAKSKQCTAQGKGSHLGRNPLFTLDRRAPGMACHLCVATHASIVTTHKRPCTHAHASKSPHIITQSRDTQIQSHPCLMCVRAHSLRAYGWGGEGKRKAGREGQREGRTLETAPSRHMWG
jgi:hypothetical protein